MILGVDEDTSETHFLCWVPKDGHALAGRQLRHLEELTFKLKNEEFRATNLAISEICMFDV